ncbi:Mitochondrial inner membrane translocase subunit Tim17/Tim22/Tim23/peroxisomal protein PMP24 [Rosa chinensis]|uniref:Mitochondrial inner membrane translocase subunit Tim17/Tim22/Tim23/peroxisomal protein PMP24 n=1 Tax=Rosa chinensis TaxID=74649 RepID=A0A2P6RJU4_ROSCH|nr:Mitochondrial inner membrane translocase subunit Tim17/Tim22/Tim23/peroxisomal protein PMP24 [Rosa chinensis]
MWNGLPWERWSYKVIERPCSVTKPLQQARLFPSQRTSSSSSLLLYFSLFNRQNPENLNPDRETCPKPSPDHVVNVVGGTFGVGFVFGGALHFLKGIYNSPGGARLAGAAQAIRINAPLVGGRFAVWGGLFSTFDCTLEHMWQKEDHWNRNIAGASARCGRGSSRRRGPPSWEGYCWPYSKAWRS